ncbi:MAG TPA: tyrosine-protein phosphatase [Macromonas sp.]|nr:tyrosine-protein phosphatase [Macromonas sp.]
MTQTPTPLFEGIDNFRDFGQVPSRLGRLRRGALLRSGALDKASPDDLQQLQQLDIGLIVDLRGSDERAKAPSQRSPGFQGQVLELLEVNHDDAPHLGLLSGLSVSRQALATAMTEFYCRIPFDPSHMRHFATAFQAMTRTPGATLVHCAAGKDRTGIFVALLLELLGVHRDDIHADYLLSAQDQRLKERLRLKVKDMALLKGREVAPDAVDVLVGVDPVYINAMLHTLTERCGSVEGYLQHLALDPALPEQLRQRYLL